MRTADDSVPIHHGALGETSSDEPYNDQVIGVVYVTKSTLITSILLAASTAAASPNSSQLARDNAFYEVDGVWHRSEHGCGTAQVAPVADPSAKPAPPAIGLRTVFLNKNGGTYTPGSTNSATNSRSIPCRSTGR
jgi:hypothetical protein